MQAHKFEVHENQYRDRPGEWCKHCNTTRDEVKGMHLDVEIRPTPEGYVFVPLTDNGLEKLLYTSVQDHDERKRVGWLGTAGVMTAERAKELQARLKVLGCTVAGGL